jgi:hypothetical protein
LKTTHQIFELNKTEIMKLPKTLLSAILIGIAVQTTSCTKELCDDKDKKEEKKEVKNTPDGCPACGMG